jgi:hypothetical protein
VFCTGVNWVGYCQQLKGLCSRQSNADWDRNVENKRKYMDEKIKKLRGAEE